AEDGIRDRNVTGVQTCALPICDRTLALLLGLRASLGVAIACTALAFALFGWAAVVLGVRAWLLVVPLVAWVAVLVPWYRRRDARSEERRVGKECRSGCGACECK